jgi:hypothetical protein
MGFSIPSNRNHDGTHMRPGGIMAGDAATRREQGRRRGPVTGTVAGAVLIGFSMPVAGRDCPAGEASFDHLNKEESWNW